MILDLLSICSSKNILYSHLLNSRARTSLFRHPYVRNKVLLIKKLYLFKPKPTLLGPLITFVYNFQILILHERSERSERSEVKRYQKQA